MEGGVRPQGHVGQLAIHQCQGTPRDVMLATADPLCHWINVGPAQIQHAFTTVAESQILFIMEKKYQREIYSHTF